MKKLVMACGAVMAALALATPASAQQNGSVTVGGYEPVACGVNPQTTVVNFGDLPQNGASGALTVNYSFYCNTNFTITTSSQNGRLLNTSAPVGQVGPETGGRHNEYLPAAPGTFYAALDYSLWNETLYGGGGYYLHSSGFAAGAPVGPNVASAPLSISVPFSFQTTPVAGNITAGTYTDVITFTVAPGSL